MAQLREIPYREIYDRLQVRKPWDMVIIFGLNLLIAIPVFLIAHQNLVDPDWPVSSDRILIFVLIVTLIQFVLRVMRRIIIIAIALYLIALVYGSIFGNYGFESVYDDYRALVYAMAEDPYPQDIIITKLLPFPNKSKIISAIDYQNPRVRNFAVAATTLHFQDIKKYRDYRQIIQCFAAFKEVNARWNYVNDPKGRDYIATAGESTQLLSGDCDDYSVLMAACVRAIGGTPRLIHTTGHMYPEILVGDKTDLEMVHFLIKKVLFAAESKDKDIHYHIDERGQIWLNLDYTARYPGGPFMSEEILGALTLN